MKKSIIALVFTMLATQLFAPSAILTTSSLGGGNLQIVAKLLIQPERQYFCVLQSTTNFDSWTAISTNGFPVNGMVTNIVQARGTMCFYRVEVR